YCAYPPLFCFRTLTFFPDPATTHIYTLSLHDALPISIPPRPISSPTSYRPLIIRCWDTVFLIGRYAAGSAPLFGEVVRLVEPEEAEAPSWSSVSLSALSSASVSSAFSPGFWSPVLLFWSPSEPMSGPPPPLSGDGFD